MMSHMSCQGVLMHASRSDYAWALRKLVGSEKWAHANGRRSMADNFVAKRGDPWDLMLRGVLCNHLVWRAFSGKATLTDTPDDEPDYGRGDLLLPEPDPAMQRCEVKYTDRIGGGFAVKYNPAAEYPLEFPAYYGILVTATADDHVFHLAGWTTKRTLLQHGQPMSGGEQFGLDQRDLFPMRDLLYRTVW